MARNNVERDQGTEKGKIRVLFIELEGNNQTLQDGLRTVSQMLPRPVQVQVPPKLLQNSAAGTAANAQPNEPNLFSPDTTASEGVDAEDVEQEEAGTVGTARKKRGEGTKTDRNAGINPVADLDFVPDDKPSLKTFFAEKAPASDMEQVLVLGYYIQHSLELTAFGPGHILSAFKHVAKPVPVDLRQTIRNMKKAKVWFSFTDIDSIRLTTEGENVVEHDLPRKGNNDNGNIK